MKKWLVVPAIVLIVAVVLTTTGLVLPRLITAYQIERSKDLDPKVARDAFERLIWMGRWAVPSLMQAMSQRDSQLEMLRTQPCPESFTASEWQHQLRRMRVASPIERQADCMMVPLLQTWQEGSLDERNQRRLLRYLFEPAVAMTRKRYGTDAKEIAVDVSMTLHVPLYDREFKFAHKTKVNVMVDGDVDHPAIKQQADQWMMSISTFSGQTRPGAHPSRAVSLSSSGSGGTYSLEPSALSPGKHTVVARFLIGPADPSETSLTGEPPRWHEEFAAGPVEFEIGEAVDTVRVDSPEVDRAMAEVLSLWKLTVPRGSPGRLQLRPESANLELTAPLAGDLYLSVDRKWGTMDLGPIEAGTVLPDLQLAMPEQIMLNPGRYVITVTFLASREVALRTGLDSYWFGAHEFPPLEVEVGSDGSLAPIDEERE